VIEIVQTADNVIRTVRIREDSHEASSSWQRLGLNCAVSIILIWPHLTRFYNYLIRLDSEWQVSQSGQFDLFVYGLDTEQGR
jgi:hypothetical protein